MDIYLAISNTVEFASMAVGFIYIGRELQILDDGAITVEKIKINLKIMTDFLKEDNKSFNPAELQRGTYLAEHPEIIQ